MTGGRKDGAKITSAERGLTSVELLHDDGSPWCSLPDLPQGLSYHSQTRLEACGGAWHITECVKFSKGNWTTSYSEEHSFWAGHSSWASPLGTVLIGGTAGSHPRNMELLPGKARDCKQVHENCKTHEDCMNCLNFPLIKELKEDAM